MLWLARILLFIPAIVAGWFVSPQDPRFWVVTMAIALAFMAVGIIAAIYAPGLRRARKKGRSN